MSGIRAIRTSMIWQRVILGGCGTPGRANSGGAGIFLMNAQAENRKKRKP